MLIGVHSSAFTQGQSLAEAVEASLNLGLRAFELFAEVQNNHFGRPAVGYWAAGHTEREWEEVATLLQGRFARLTVHAPLEGSGANITASNPGIREEAQRQVQRTIDFAAFVGAEVVVVHHGWPAAFASPSEFFAQSRRALEKFATHAAKRGVRLGVENVHSFFASPEQLWELIAPFPAEAVGFCLDTGHCPLCYLRREERTPERANEVLLAAVRCFGPRLVNVHAHDYDGQRDHRALARGWFDWQRVVGTLEEVGYRGALMLEINEEDDLTALQESLAQLAASFSHL
ncbi:MAG TPA: sugar phosphate isomerase/epimerase [Armatimonadetes bacterium]|nr:sugar phosphate isomerase/epimerase [Armatimonadota bacterium]